MPKGSCPCGQYTYEVPEDSQATVVCHCLPCRKFAGMNGSTNAVTSRDKYKHLSGEVKTWTRKGESGKSVTNAHCANCYCLLWVEAEFMPDAKIFKPGTLDDKEWLDKHPVVKEVYCRNRPDCLGALDDAAQAHDAQ